MFRLLALSLPFLLIGLVNFALYLCGAGHDTRLILPAGTADPNVQRLNSDANYAYFLDRELAGPQPRHFSVPKPEGVYRIVVVGASTVEGFPYVTELSFARQLELALGRQLDDQQVEVLNAGIVGISSFAVVDIVRQVLAAHPDLIVVYTGHNEFYGPGGVGSTGTWGSPSLYPLLTAARRFRLFQAVATYASPSQSDRPLIETLPADLAIPLDAPAVGSAEQYYRSNLTQMAELVAPRDTSILFCGVACNLRDQSPLGAIPSPDLTAEQAESRDRWLNQVSAELEAGDATAALAAADQAAEIDEQYALAAYRRAQCLEALGKTRKAADAYQRACDLDGCRFRAPSSFRSIAQEVAADAAPERAFYVDLAAELAASSKYPAPGHDFFVEHVHFHREGHWQVALVLAETITEQVLGRTWAPDRVPPAEDRDQWLATTVYDDLVAFGLAYDILHNRPLDTTPDHERELEFTRQRLQELTEATPPEDMLMFIRLDNDERQLDLLNALGTALLERGLDERAWEMFERAKRRRPWQATSYLGAAKALHRLGRTDEALADIELALTISPDVPELQRLHADLAESVRGR